MATIYQVSELANVSLATVSRVINNSSAVKKETREKVEQAMLALNYKPNSVAKSLASNRSDCIGVLVTELEHAFFSSMMAAVEAECRKYGKHTIVAASGVGDGAEEEGIEFLISRNCDGLIIQVESISDEYLIKLAKGKIPFVVVNRYIEAISNNCIVMDNEEGEYLATKYLIEHGHKDIVYVTGPLNKNDARMRLQGYKRALNEFNIRFDQKRLYEGDYEQSGGQDAFNHFYNSSISFTAFLCANDEMATAVMAAARDKGIDIPNDLSVFGFDDLVFSRYTFPRLSTIEQPIKKMGTMAARIVLQQVYKQHVGPIQQYFTAKIIERESVARIHL